MPTQRDQIICVRVAQRKLHNPESKPIYDYFPYDRVYLAPKKLASVFRKAFRYYLSMPLSSDLLTGLNALQVDFVRESPVTRNEFRSEKRPGKRWGAFNSLIETHKGWILVVPTHVFNKYRDPETFKDPYASAVGYIMSRAVQHGHNEKAQMPRITFHTPTRTIPVLCTVCKNLPEYHANECSPGTFNCRISAESELPLDSEFFLSRKQSAQSVGGDK